MLEKIKQVGKMAKQALTLKSDLKDKRATRQGKTRVSKTKSKDARHKRFMDLYKEHSANKRAKWEYKSRTSKSREAGRSIRSAIRTGGSAAVASTNDGKASISDLLKQEYTDQTVSSGSTGTAKKSTNNEDNSYDEGIGNY